jgi:hypothetical protein
MSIKDYTKAIVPYQQAVVGGCAYATCFLGDINEEGLGVIQNSEQARC